VTRTPQSFIAYAPFGIGLMCALVYFERDSDVYGWWTGARDSDHHSAYFRLEYFYSTKPTRFYATEGMDLYGGWRYLYTAREPVLDKPLPVDDAAAHELDRVQGMFAAEWLVFADDPHAGSEREAYARMGLPLGRAAVRSRRLGRLDESQAVWIHRSRGFDAGVLRFLQQYWPLDYRAS
jgi:hypothetical protein